MPPNNEVQTALDAMGDPQETSLSSTHRGFSRLTTRSGLSGGVGPLRPPRPPTSISVNLDIGIVRGFIEDLCFSDSDNLPRSTVLS